LDYFTSGGTAGCPALLVEPSAQNFVLNSDNSSTSWTLGAGTASGYVDVIGVSGNTITATASGGIGSNVFLRRTLNTALSSGSTYTVSFLMRQTGAHTIGGYWIGIAGVGDIGGGFDVSGSFSSGAIYSAAGATNRIRRVERWGTDVYRCSETFTLTASGTVDRILMGPLGAVNNPAITSSGNTMAFAAPQIELGAVPTTFIPTTTGSATRNADVVTLSGAVSGCIGQTEGTMYAEVDLRASASSSARRIVNMRVDGNNLLSLEIPTAGTSIEFSAVSGGSSVTATATGITTGIYKIAVGYNSAASGTVLYVNGTLRDTKTIAIPNLSAAVFGLGVRADGSAGSQFNDRIRAAALYTTRLTNAELQSLTTL
jgi:hypothetical protein